MKKLEKVVFMVFIIISLNVTMGYAQWEMTKSPSEQTMEQIQAEFGSLPFDDISSPELRVSRPIDETPIGGIRAPLPDASVLSILSGLLLYIFVKRRRLINFFRMM